MVIVLIATSIINIAASLLVISSVRISRRTSAKIQEIAELQQQLAIREARRRQRERF